MLNAILSIMITEWERASEGDVDRWIGKVLKDFLVDKILMKKINFNEKNAVWFWHQKFCCEIKDGIFLLINDDIFVAVL